MVYEFLNADSVCEFGDSADMINMVVSYDQVINLLDLCVLECGHDAPNITDGAIATRVDEHRFSEGGNEKHGIATLDVYYVNVQGVCSPGLCNSTQCGNDQNPYD